MIIFSNDGEIDLTTLRMFGLSAKEGKNPIGFFGTGMKYGIAILLRTEHVITLWVGEHPYAIRAETELVRGKEFQVVKLVDMDASAGEYEEQLGFTTDVGRNWSVKDAYREFWSNCMDEGGRVQSSDSWVGAMPGTTNFVVSGAGIEEAHDSRGSFILTSMPIATVPGILEIHAGESSAYFYRGFRVSDMPEKKRGKYTYNILSSMELTEDRTARYGFMLPSLVGRAVVQLHDAAVIDNVLGADKSYVEHTFDYEHVYGESEEFLEAVNQRTAQREHVNPTALGYYWGTMRRRRSDEIVTVLSADARQNLDNAIAFAGGLDIPLSQEAVLVTDNLGAGKVVLAEDDKIYVLTSVVEDATPGAADRLAMHLIRSWVELHHDTTESAVEFLSTLLVAVARRLAALEAEQGGEQS